MANDKELEITVDYNELLQRAVAVLERTRISIARSISDNISNAHWEIGRLLQEKKLDSKHVFRSPKQPKITRNNHL